ncbi:hypothetical protein [Aurantimonas endophytica]|uniref:Uncharacterized protein n=1 Tax=Aurantimonas endophytica TaxID=1522175 RepID=A0A7W6HFR2_9HYPH|nr:hypothetical protein [Aurantimonas endophytica]MBB4004182.1 hypothetical protein [Aurantimonas endophytica]MCO6405025.1 hypothetical protein [Aurantimonas endophytica]
MAGSLDTTSLDAALAAAIRCHAERQRRSVARDLQRLEKAVLLRRLGLDDAAVRQAIAVERATQLPAALGIWLRERVTVELQRLTRMARGAHPRYDINRHIAVRRLANWLEGHDERPAEEADERTAGRVLNARFVRHHASAAKLRRRQA